MKFHLFKVAEIDSELAAITYVVYTHSCITLDNFFQVNTNFSLTWQEVRKEEDKLIGASVSESHTSKSPMQLTCHRPCTNNYRNNRKLTIKHTFLACIPCDHTNSKHAFPGSPLRCCVQLSSHNRVLRKGMSHVKYPHEVYNTIKSKFYILATALCRCNHFNIEFT